MNAILQGVIVGAIGRAPFWLIALGVAAAGAGIASRAAGLPFALTLLAFSPGGSMP